MAERRSHLTLMGLILVALLGAALLAIPGTPIHKKPTLGLDLQGGLEVVLKAKPDRGQAFTKSDLSRSVEIMRQRVDKLGVAEPEIRTQGSDQIVIELPGVHNQERAAELIGKTAKLELYDLQGDLVTGASLDLQGFPIAQTSIFQLLSTVQPQAKKGLPQEVYLVRTITKGKQVAHRVVVGPVSTRAEIFSSRYVSKRLTKAQIKKAQLPKNTEILAVPENMVVITCGKAERYCPGAQGTPSQTYFYLFKYDPQNTEHNALPIPEMTGSDLSLKGTRADIDPQTSEPIVLMSFTGKGAKKFQKITQTLAERGKGLFNSRGGDPQNYFQQFAIVLDREIRSAPTIDFNQNPNGIPGNNGAQITGIGSQNGATDLALVLQTGALPVNYVTIERTDISATLGKDSLQQAKKAAIGGLLVVALFLLLFYRFLGLVAVIGLGIYVVFLYGALLLLNVTLTLPGFAGLILTIGVAADANVVVFERIKEEVRAGKSVRAAISAGYSKGFHTIIDANVVTAITALVLFLVATAGVKGFALMLLIGTAISLITAVAATRAMLGLLAGFRWFDNPQFMGAAGAQGAKWLQIDFMRRRYLWFAISGMVVLIASVSLGVRGLNLGIDFKGGTQVTFSTPQPQLVDSVRSDAQQIDTNLGRAQIVGRGPSSNGEYKSFQLRTKSLPPALGAKLRTEIENKFQATHYGSKNVSESFGKQIAKSAGWAIFGSLLLIILYLAIRFDLKFAIPVIGALIHDIVITVGVYSLTGREVSTATVAAVLTVLGYSIYDTIIIFDRIRENVPLMRRASFATITNISLWETIRRSLATTFITLLPVASLLFFGGATLKDFAFALMVGITSGAYSSIFIAAPLLTILKEREPEYARKIGQADDGLDEGPDGGSPARRRPRSPIGGPAVDTGTMTLEAAEQAAAAQPGPSLTDLVPEPAPSGSAKAKRERRRQRRRARPHGRR